MNQFQLGSKEFFRACRDLATATYQGKVPQEILDGIVNLVPDGRTDGALGAPNGSATVTVAAAFIYGTVDCKIDSQKKQFRGTHWGLGLAGFAATGILYTAYNRWEDFFKNATGYHAQSAGVAGGIVQVTWFTREGLPVGQFNGIAGGVGALEVGGSGSWENL